MSEYVCELEDARYEMDWTPKEEIVRCRDCEYYYPHGVPTCQRNRECVTGYDINGDYGEWYDGEFYVEPDGFCAWAKRKEGGE